MNNPKKKNTPVPNSAQPTAPVQTAQPTVPSASENQTKAKELNKAFRDAARFGVIASREEKLQNVGAAQVTPSDVNYPVRPNNTINQTLAAPNSNASPYVDQLIAQLNNGNANVGNLPSDPAIAGAMQAYQSAIENYPMQPSGGNDAKPAYGYDPNVDYQALINEAVAAGNYQLAAIYELQRNAKIAGQGMNYEPTNLYSSYLPGGANYSSTTTTTHPNQSDLSPMINQMHDAVDQQIKTNINYETQQAADQLRRALQDAQGSYEDAIARQLIETQQARDAQALRNQVNGDRGGIGSAQVDSITNTGAKNREAIAAQQRQLSTDTARQLADLRAQGKYEEANQLLQSAQQRLAALYEEQVRLQQMEETQKSTLASLGSQYLQAGLMPNDQMLAALGIDPQTAQLYVAYAKEQNSASDKANLANLATQYLQAGLMPNQAMLDALGMDAATAQLYADYAKQQNNASQLASLGSEYLSAGLMPNQAMLDALGIDAATAQQYIDYVKSQAKSGGTTGGIVNNGPDNDDPDDDGPDDGKSNPFIPVTDYETMSTAAKAGLAFVEQNMPKQEVIASYIAHLVTSGGITAPEAAALAFAARLVPNYDQAEAWAKAFYETIGASWPHY